MASAQAFLELVQPHLHGLYVTACRYLGRPEDANDLVQETLLRAWRAFSPASGRTYRRAWLYTIMRHVVTEWNGLMIAALARAATVLDEPRYAQAARRAADFVLDQLRDDRGRLLKRYRDGEAGLPAHAEDYAFFIWGLLELYEATFEVKYLQTAIELNRDMLDHFWDDAGGGFFFTADDGEELLVRSKEIYDGAIPSANSVAMLNLLRIGRITADGELETKAARIGAAFSARVALSPSAHAQLMCGLDFGVGPSHEIVIAGAPDGEDTRRVLKALHGLFIPNKIVLMRPAGEPPITRIAEFTATQTAADGRTTVYVCQNYACKLPTTDPGKMLELLTGTEPARGSSGP